MGKYLVGILGIALILGVAVLLSADRRAIRLRVCWFFMCPLDAP